MNIRNTIIAGTLAITVSQGASADTSRRDFVDAMFEAFNAHDVEKLKTFYSEDAVVYSPESCEPTVGREAIGASYAEMFAQIPDVQDHLEVVVSDGDKTAIIFTASSEAPGAEFQLPISAFLTIEDGLVVEDRVFFNSDLELDCGQ
ncbi:MAG: nuclear transport factor 2 family protein [Pseudomonadota bacterium]